MCLRHSPFNGWMKMRGSAAHNRVAFREKEGDQRSMAGIAI